MAANLLKSGHEVFVYNRTHTKTDALVVQGAKAADNVPDACRGEAVITMLANDDAVEEVAFGDGGVIASLSAGVTHVSSSTISVALSEKLERARGRAGQRFVAAPLFRRLEAAAAGQLFVVAAGADDAVQVATPMLEPIGQ
jgi:3-hydroxyisobutyrate dehydrogenase-like beta-hydroxyacid dehydrogenase